MSITKVVLLFTCWKKKIIFRELQLIFDTKNWVWKSKNALFWWLGALSFCQIWKNLLVPMNVDLKDYSILGAYLQIVLPWITILTVWYHNSWNASLDISWSKRAFFLQNSFDLWNVRWKFCFYLPLINHFPDFEM